MRPFSRFLSLGMVAFLSLAVVAENKNKTKAEAKVADEIRFLASDELEGRGVQTEGIRKAAEYIRSEFKAAGLKSGVADGSYYQKFPVPLRGKGTQIKRGVLVLRGPDGQELKLKAGKDFQPFLFGGSGKAKAELVFAGYGISAPKLKYDDYKEKDVAGKIVVIVRREPQQGDEKSVFNGKEVTPHSYIRTKLGLARSRKIAGVLMVNDPFSTPNAAKDSLVSVDLFGPSPYRVPFGQLKISVLNKILSKSPVVDSEKHELKTAASVAKHIDEHLAPMTQALKGWTAEIDFELKTAVVDAENVVGVLEGEGPLANETIVIGAHYDHLGSGGRFSGSRVPARKEIHNGADDNATGTAAVLELARRFAAQGKPKRRLVFIAFSGEESGLVGSRHYINAPLFPLKDTVAMINYDMIGMLRENRVTISGAGSAKVFSGLLDNANKGVDFTLIKKMGRPGGSDQLPFYGKKIPVVHFFTGLTKLYHTPEDDYEELNIEGVHRVIDLSHKFVEELVKLEKRPAFVAAPRRSRTRPQRLPYLGVLPDRGATVGKGVVVDDITAGSPAAKSGFKPGDLIVKLGKDDITDVASLIASLGKRKAKDKVKIVVKRGKEMKTLEVELGVTPR